MEEKERNSLTISDILDQLVRPPITQSPGIPPRPISQPPNVSAPINIDTEQAIKLPQLGKVESEIKIPSKSAQPQLSKLNLSVRTMTDDLEKLKKGQRPSVLETKIYSPLTPPPLKSQSPQRSLPPKPALPPIRPAPPPSILPLPPITEPKHYHQEKVVSKEELLPPFLGAPIPKKNKKLTEEKVQYGLIAKIIGSGMTTGIIITFILAAIAYGLLYFFYLQGPEVPTISATPVPIEATTTPFINELEAIFGSVGVVNFQLPDLKEEILPSFKSFVSGQILSKKEFKIINITRSSSQEQTILSFTDLMDSLSLNYPSDLKNEISVNHMVLLYGQDELFIEPMGFVPQKIVFITEVKDIVKIFEIMRKWEQTMPEDLKNIFNIDPLKQASQLFLDNDRQGIKIKYKNFPLPDKSIDYSILSSLTNHHYLVITNSRESMFSPTDKIRGL